MKNKKTTPEPSAPEPTPRGRVSIGDIVSEMQQSYLDYAMSVIVSRALPDVRDGLKPVHRRILYAMRELGLTHHAKPRKSATVVGEVLGKYHPHGDAPVYEAMVRMAQTFSFRYPLVIGQGNFGSIDGDAPAAMRYTEAKMSPIAAQLLTDIEKNTVDFMPNYDGTKREPTLLPAAFPHLLVNGSLGIAVGMATNIPPHNLTEIINGTMHLIDNPKADVDDLIQFITGPDFPTGGLIFNQKDIREAYTTGRGGIVTRGEAEIVENKKGGHQIVITSIPYQVNKSEMISKMANLVHEKKLDGIRDIRDESDRDGLRVVIDLKGDAYPQKVLNYLYKHTDLERTFHCNILALIDGIQPKTLSLRDILDEFVKSRVVVVERRTKYDLDVARRRVHILEGLSKALNNIEAVIKVIKSSKDRAAAREGLIKKFKLSEIQANAILEMRLHTLAGLERKQIEDELKEKRALAAELESLLKSPKKIRDLIKTELTDLKERYGDERRTTLVKSAAA
ncbi:MAG: DNA topoisomerase (ATP-hydrolyzing), partial [Patescibacteria group bacterium]